MFSEFHFLRPLWLLALLPLLFLLWRWIRMQRSGGLWEKVIDPALIKHVMKSHSVGVRQFWSPVVFGLIAVLLIVAMAGPVWQRWPQPVYGTQDPLVVVLDLSRSMDAGDTKPNRLTRARHKIRDLLRRRPDGQTALIVYAAQAFVVTPLTQDTDTIASLVPVLETDLMPEQGTRPDLALEEARELLTQSDAGPGHVLLITDGIDGVDIDEILDDLKQAGHRVSVLGVGTVAGAPIPSQSGGFITDKSGEVVVTKLNTEELRKVAERGQGGFQILGAGNSDLLALLQNMAAREVGEVQAGLKTDVWREEGPWLLLAALPLVALAFRRGVIPIVLLVICLPLAQPSHALEWRDLWRTKDQQGADAMAEENPEVAAELFDNPNWKAVAKYHNGDYADSAELWSNDTTVTAHYNRGNALARQGPQYFDEAIASYDQALDLDPDHEDAQFNRDLLVQQQEQQDQQQEGNSSEQDQDEESEQEGSSQESESEDSEQQQEQQEQESEGEQQEQQEAQAQYDEEFESDQADEQWLRKIPDDPGGLLRRKFRYQYKRRNPSRGRQNQEEKW